MRLSPKFAGTILVCGGSKGWEVILCSLLLRGLILYSVSILSFMRFFGQDLTMLHVERSFFLSLKEFGQSDLVRRGRDLNINAVKGLIATF